jgi:hypothetical protein
MQGAFTIITYYPQKKFTFKHIPDCERIVVDMLENYWGRYVVLFSSGRSALKAYLLYKNYNLHRNSISIPKYLSKCVLDAITDCAFPKWLPDQTHALLYYHQYGYIQNCNFLQNISQRYELIIEDCAHTFFYKSNLGIPSIVSFSKFFNVGCGGALIIDSQQEKDEILALRDSQLSLSVEKEKFVQKGFFANLKKYNLSKEIITSLPVIYAMILTYIRPLTSTISNLPMTINALMSVRQERLDRFEILKNHIVNKKAREYLKEFQEPPFIVPCCFAEHNLMHRLIRELSSIDVQGAIYHIDLNKNQFAPMYEPATIIPCHQNIPISTMKRMAEIVKKY